MAEPLVSQEALRIGRKQRALPLVHALAHPAARDRFDLVVFRESPDAGFVGLVDAGREHRRGGGGFGGRGWGGGVAGGFGARGGPRGGGGRARPPPVRTPVLGWCRTARLPSSARP